MKLSLEQTFYTLGITTGLFFSTLHMAHAALDIEEQNVIYIDASSDDGDDSIYPENWSDQKKIRDQKYNPHNDSSQHFLSNARYFVINGKNAVRYYPLSEAANPALLYTSVGSKSYFALVQSYGAAMQPIMLKPQLPHQLKDHQLFNIQPHDKNLVLIFRIRYFHTPAEMARNIALNPNFKSYFYRTSYELIEVTPQGKILHRTQFTAPSPENGLGFGPKMNENNGEYEDSSIEYTTRTPGVYQTLNPYDIEHSYAYTHGKLTKHTEKRLLTPSERAEIKVDHGGVNAENMHDEHNKANQDRRPEPSSCLEDYWVYHDKAAAKNVHWGNPWLQRQPALYQNFLRDYANGKTYSWLQFRQHFCNAQQP